MSIDLDHVIDKKTGAIEPWAREIMDRFQGGYIEKSPSGDGCHILCLGKPSRNGKEGPENRLEVYGEGSPRYLTVTGYQLSSGESKEQQEALDWIGEKYLAEKETSKAIPFPATQAIPRRIKHWRINWPFGPARTPVEWIDSSGNPP